MRGLHAHLRECHGWTHEQSWAYGPAALDHLHTREHDEKGRELDHEHPAEELVAQRTML